MPSLVLRLPAAVSLSVTAAFYDPRLSSLPFPPFNNHFHPPDKVTQRRLLLVSTLPPVLEFMLRWGVTILQQRVGGGDRACGVLAV